MKIRVIIAVSVILVLYICNILIMITAYSYFPTTVTKSKSPDGKYTAEVKYRVHPLSLDWVDPESVVYFYLYDKDENILCQKSFTVMEQSNISGVEVSWKEIGYLKFEGVEKNPSYPEKLEFKLPDS